MSGSWESSQLVRALERAIQCGVTTDGDVFVHCVVDALFNDLLGRIPKAGAAHTPSLADAKSEVKHEQKTRPGPREQEQQELQRLLAMTPAQALGLERVEFLARCKGCGTGLSPQSIQTRAGDENATEVYQCPACGKVTRVRG